ncbi:hypothetical protein [Marinobacter sp.]|uniref:hypothetical protein n=1 Tax=Marinobacter sp. TaxID=50741 RepID=UPI000C605741|nr:hypothetical protein [Marinobacter sp.]MBE97185.1 hypothetical protein [Marinobacter sp.]
MNEIVEFVCGSDCQTNWSAISALATTFAVMVALWIPLSERRIRRLEKFEREARAAVLVNQAISGLLEVIPLAMAKIDSMDGVLIDEPGIEILYGLDECEIVIEKEAFVHQLPASCLASGELTVTLAKMWSRQIETLIDFQRSNAGRQVSPPKNIPFTSSLGSQLYESAGRLRELCNGIKLDYENAQKPLAVRMIRSLSKRRS